MIRNIAIVLAGGVGSRLGLSTPKQFFKVAGKMVIEHTLDTLNAIRTSTKLPLCRIPFMYRMWKTSFCATGGKK